VTPGVCGVDVDQSLVELTATVRSLRELGADIQRHNLARAQLIAFVSLAPQPSRLRSARSWGSRSHDRGAQLA